MQNYVKIFKYASKLEKNHPPPMPIFLYERRFGHTYYIILKTGTQSPLTEIACQFAQSESGDVPG